MFHSQNIEISEPRFLSEKRFVPWLSNPSPTVFFADFQDQNKLSHHLKSPYCVFGDRECQGGGPPVSDRSQKFVDSMGKVQFCTIPEFFSREDQNESQKYFSSQVEQGFDSEKFSRMADHSDFPRKIPRFAELSKFGDFGSDFSSSAHVSDLRLPYPPPQGGGDLFSPVSSRNSPENVSSVSALWNFDKCKGKFSGPHKVDQTPNLMDLGGLSRKMERYHAEKFSLKGQKHQIFLKSQKRLWSKSLCELLNFHVEKNEVIMVSSRRNLPKRADFHTKNPCGFKKLDF